ncbi:hypothetical protein CPB86DRAFT_749573 [Serendipita vermifera]|nr:hypothetical protein CPB86DRAFT_749573 [Serendipita vermifera]
MEKFIQDTGITPKHVSKGTWDSEFATTSLRPARGAGSSSSLRGAGITRETKKGVSSRKQPQKIDTISLDDSDSSDDLRLTSSSQATTKADIPKLSSHISRDTASETKKTSRSKTTSTKPRASSKKQATSAQSSKKKASSKKEKDDITGLEALLSDREGLNTDVDLYPCHNQGGEHPSKRKSVLEHHVQFSYLENETDQDIRKTPTLDPRKSPSYEPAPFPMTLSPRSSIRTASPFDHSPPGDHNTAVMADWQMKSTSTDDEVLSSDS